MWTIILTLGIGILIGASVKLSDKMMALNSKLQHLGVVMLLFFMGIAIGLNRDLIAQLGQIGYKALVFGVLTSLFPILIVFVITRFILRRSHDS